MSYQDSLHPWIIYQFLPTCQRLMVERFRRRSDADSYLTVLRQLQPHAEFTIVFAAEVDRLLEKLVLAAPLRSSLQSLLFPEPHQ